MREMQIVAPFFVKKLGVINLKYVYLYKRITKTNIMTKIISKLNDSGLKVIMNNVVTVIALYKDENGEYFFNENLVKQYVKDTPKEEKEKEEFLVEEEEKEEIIEYSFEVEYEHNGRANGFALKETTVKAKSYEQAIEKVKNRFRNIFEISEL